MTDADLDRALGAALAVDPSPAFLARVRTRLSEEPDPRAWALPFPVWFAGSAVVAAAVLLAVVVMRPDRVSPDATGSPLAARSIAGGTASLPGGLSGAGPSLRETRNLHSEFRTPHSPFRIEEPVFDARESLALRALILGVRTGGVDLSPMLRPSALGPQEPEPIADLDIQPIAIDPIAPLDGAQGARQ